MQNPSYEKLEFHTIKNMLAEHALSDRAREKCLALAPFMSESGCRARMDETTGARTILDARGNPPLTAMQDMEGILTLAHAGAMLTADQLTAAERFLVACARMKSYLEKAEDSCAGIAAWGGSFDLLPALGEEINRCIRAGRVEDEASSTLASLRRKLESLAGQVQSQLASLAQRHKQWLSDSAPVRRNGRYVLGVRREHKARINGAVVELSSTGSTVFIEPASVAKLQQQAAGLELEAENEERRVLYTLTALVDADAPTLRRNMEAMESLDFLFAKAKLSAAMAAGPVELTAERRLNLVQARHPLLPRQSAVPLDLSLDGETHGIIITGPNTGGKTVALKTVGLLCLMAQCGLHVTAGAGSRLCLFSGTLCDVGDGQSISENLSTFSSHMTAIIDILAQAGPESLVLLDELGSGTDPAEGMGIAIAVLEALRKTGCMLVATTHYPEVKQYAQAAAGYTNARMAFNRQTLQPTYRLEVGLAGESCALYIAQRLGLPQPILQHAQRQAYQDAPQAAAPLAPPPPGPAPAQSRPKAPGLLKAAAPARPTSAHAASFGFGDGVLVYPAREHGIVYAAANGRGEVGVQVKGEKRLVPHKRLKLVTKAEQLYPPDYDFSVVFDSVANRKARKQMEKGHHIAGNVIVHSGPDTGQD